MSFALVFLGLVVIFSYGMGNVAAANNTTGDNIYVDTHGNDSWDGLSATHSGSTGPKLTIQNATGTVNTGGTVNIANGYYSGTKNNNITIDKDMNIKGQSQNGTIISGSGTNWIFYIPTGVNVTISNLSLINGTRIVQSYPNEHGGAIDNHGNLTVNNCNLNNNKVAKGTIYGGAISNTGDLTVNNSYFNGNTAKPTNAVGQGGAIYNTGVLSLYKSTFNNNAANGNNANGGAINNIGTMNITLCSFTNNTATSSLLGEDGGGAIYNTGVLSLYKSTFNNNAANGNNANGGAITNIGTMNITLCSFTNNTATSSLLGEDGGGAIFNIGNMTVTCSNFIRNNAQGPMGDWGGAIYNGGGTSSNPVTVSSCTFTDNAATNEGPPRGGAIFNAGFMSIQTSTFTGNNAFIGGAIDNDYGTLNVSNSTFTSNFSVNGGYGGAINNYGILTALSNTFKDNSAGTGGAIYTPSLSYIHFNQFVGNYGGTGTDIEDNGGEITDASLNWWGSNAGPTTSTSGNPSTNVFGNVTVKPWLVLTVSAKPNIINTKNNSTVTVDLLYDSNGVFHDPSNGCVPDGIPVIFSGNIGTINPLNTTLANGQAQAIFTSNNSGTGNIIAKVDSQSVSAPIMVGPPTIKTITPTNNAMNIPSDQMIKITFSEAIKAGNMDITLTNSKGIPVTITTSINGNILTINHKALLTNGKYTLTLHTGSITDLASNNLAVCSRCFTVYSMPPTIKTITPVKNAVNVPTNQIIKITFSKPIKAGSMFIELKNSTGNEIKFTQTISGNTLTLKPTAYLSKGVKYTILLHTGCITDLANNNLAPCTSCFTTV